ncbi:MAG TPA: hypothetical protein VFY23_01605 [Candidatus Limnocylindrales bacterium]|nr:hypothetical protein [Candidatus Limnocylindrales bacterium]
MNRVTLRHIDVVRAANIVAVLYAVAVIVIGLLVFLPLALVGGLASIGTGDGNAGMAMGAGVLGGLMLLAFSVVAYGVLGWITTAIACWLYNLVATRIGGLRFVVDVEGPAPSFPVPPYGGSPQMPAGPMTPPASTPWPAPGHGSEPPPAPGR